MRFEPLSNYLPSGSPVDITGTAGEALSQYNVVYCDSADSGKWKKADSDVEATADCWGIVVQVGGIADDASGKIRLFGIVENPSWTWTKGKKLYLSGTAGLLTETTPTNEYVVAHALSATQIFFAASGGGGSGGSMILDDLTDVNISSPSDGYMIYRSSSNWIGLSIGSAGNFLVRDIAGTSVPLWTQFRDTIVGTAGETIFEGAVLYYKRSDSRYYLAEASGTEEQRVIAGLAYAASTAGNPVTVVRQGYFYKASWTWTSNGYLYLSSGGYMSLTRGQGVDVIVGRATATTAMYVFPVGDLRTGETVIGTFGETVGGYSAVARNDIDGEWYYPGTSGVNLSLIGICTYAGMDGTVACVRVSGTVFYSGWTLTPGKWVYWDNATKTFMHAPTDYRVGIATSATSILLWGAQSTILDAGDDGQILRFSEASQIPDWSSESVPGRGEYSPIEFQYKDADEITIQMGVYHKAGSLIKSRYRGSMADFWLVDSAFDVDCDAAFSQGVTNGMVGGKVNSSWYSVWMVAFDGAYDSYEIMVLPYIRVYADSYSAGNIIINPGSHSTPSSAENGFVNADDVFNDCVLYKISPFSNHIIIDDGLWITDTVNTTPDQIKIEIDDYTSEISQGDWFLMSPEGGATYSCYLGDIYFDGSGNIQRFYKSGRRTTWHQRVEITPIKNTTPSQTDLVTGVSPLASTFSMVSYVNGNTDTIRGVNTRLFCGTETTYELQGLIAVCEGTAMQNYRVGQIARDVLLTLPGKITNSCVQTADGTTWVAANTATFFVSDYAV